MLIRSISGLRGTVGKPESGLDTEVVSRYACSFAAYHDARGVIAVGYDGRVGGSVFYDACIAALRTAGCDVLALGMVPTPTVQMAVELRPEVVGGISMTASHNPAEWNGMKFVASTGLFLDAEENSRLWDFVDAGALPTVDPNEFGEMLDGSQVLSDHLEAVLSIQGIDTEHIRARGLRVALDASNASGSFIQPKLLEALGVKEILRIHADGSGVFAHRPEPIPQNLTSLRAAILHAKADVGIVVDPDADRLVLIMENGEPFIEENTIVVAVEEVLKRLPRGQKVVVNLSTTRAVDDIATNYGATVIRTPVGEINVAKRMREVGAVIGGEGSGGVILPEVHLGRDSLVGVALILNAIATSGLPLSEFRKQLPQYEIVKATLALESKEKTRETLDKLEAEFLADSVSTNHEDGLRVDFAHAWIHVRSSNTEPILRLIAEAPTQQDAEAIVARAKRAIA